MNENPRGQQRPERAPDTLDRWAAAASAELGIEPSGDFIKTVLNLARVAAHRDAQQIGRQRGRGPVHPVGQGRPLPESARQLQDLAQAWPGEAGE